MRANLISLAITLMAINSCTATVFDSLSVRRTSVYNHLSMAVPITSSLEYPYENVTIGIIGSIGLSRWYFFEQGWGFYVKTSLLLYNTQHSSQALFKVQQFENSYIGAFNDLMKVTGDIQLGPTFELFRKNNFELHAFITYGVYMTKWKLEEHILTKRWNESDFASFNRSYYHSDVYIASAHSLQALRYMSIGLSTLFKQNKMHHGLDIWIELHPPRTYQHEMRQVSSNGGFHLITRSQSPAFVALGACFKTRLFSKQIHAQ